MLDPIPASQGGLFVPFTMKILLRVVIGFFSVIGFVVIVIAALMILNSNGLLGHSDTFNTIDADNDGDLSYREWMGYYGYPNHGHPLDQCGRVDFYQADCDVDDNLTWREYHNFRFKHKSCNITQNRGWSPPDNNVLHQDGEVDPPAALYALSGDQSRWPAEYRHILRARTQKLADREAELMKKYGITRP